MMDSSVVVEVEEVCSSFPPLPPPPPPQPLGQTVVTITTMTIIITIRMTAASKDQQQHFRY